MSEQNDAQQAPPDHRTPDEIRQWNAIWQSGYEAALRDSGHQTLTEARHALLLQVERADAQQRRADDAEARATVAEQERDEQMRYVEAGELELIDVKTQLIQAKRKLAAAEARVTALAQREAELRKALQEHRIVGSQLANIAYNIGDNGLTKNTPQALACMVEMRRKWDALHVPPDGPALASPSTPSPGDECPSRIARDCPVCSGEMGETGGEPSTPSPDACAPGAEPLSRSRLKREAVQRGEPMPTFEAQPPQRPGAQPEAAEPKES